ncbi:MAG: glycosyltransferase family 2 protein, partial [Selenomonadaceae bacterium]|nr:glycosyltransferase family 2 protein [Selenomonadaceae bacterium]
MLNVPAVSVIIPLYNAEKYLAECLESVLAQTLKNFEVIVVDDCSTDSSVAIVESYIPKFGGRLKLSHMDVNSGKPSMPRNKGSAVSRGEYIYFMDDDDLITPTALEELYKLAKRFDADVVYCEKYYTCGANRENLRLTSEQKPGFVDKPTLETDYFPERIKKILEYSFIVMPWAYFSRRDLLTEHEISFPNIIRDDSIWSWNLIFSAKKILRVPNAVYIWRLNEKSFLHKERSPQATLKFWLNPIIFGVKALDEFMGGIEFFRQNPSYRCAILEVFVHSKTAQIFDTSLKLSLAEIYTSIKNDFGESLGEHDVLISWLLTD